MNFVHLHCHSGYSLLEGTATPKTLIGAARKQGMGALALTDRNTLYGAVSFYTQARKAGIKPIIGMEVDLDNDDRLVLLARNLDGYRNLCQLATVLRLNADPQLLEPPGYDDDEDAPFWEPGLWGVPVFGFTGKPEKVKPPSLSLQPPPLPKEPRLPRDLLLSGRHARGLIVLAGGRQGLLYSLIMQGKMDQAAKAIGTLIAAFGEGNVFVELQQLDEKDANALPLLAGLANDMGVPIVAANDVLYLAADDAPTARALASARKGLRQGNYTIAEQSASEACAPGALQDAALREEVGTERYFKSAEEMALLFADYPQALANTNFIAEQCTLELPLYKPLFPTVDLSGGETPFSRLWKLCFAGATRRYRPLTEAVITRMKYELEVIEKLGFSPYFLVVYDIVHFAHSRDIPIMARGSAANSLVAYVLGITQVDPLEKDLLFERFLNPSRAAVGPGGSTGTDLPDIDLDLCWRRRDEVLHYIYERHGHARVATVGTHITFRLRSAWREMAKVMGVSAGRISYIGNRLPHVFELHSGSAEVGDDSELDGIEEGDGEGVVYEEGAYNGKSPRFRDEAERTAYKLAQAIEGLPRHAGMHCAGVVITPTPLSGLVPLQRAARDPGMAITQYDKDAIEDLGLVKMDILGSRALTTLVDTVQASRLGAKAGESKSTGGSELEKRLQTIPVDDERTYRMMAEGHTLGCFQLESPGMRGLLKWLRPRNLDQVAIAISLFRPGPLEGGFLEAFMRRHLGEETITYAHPSMEPILKDTKGVILFQEQFLKLVHRLGGLSLGEAEQLRKALGKTRSADERTKLGNEFVAGAIERGIDQLQAQRVWDIVAGYSGFGFCAAHAHSYALVAYRSAYMKAHYPAEYLAAQINNGGGYYGPAVYVEDARRLGIKLLVPNVNESGAWCEVPPNPRGSGSSRTIRFGLQFVKGLAGKTIDAIAQARRTGGPFHSLPDLMARVEMSRQEITSLVKVGACDSLADENAVHSMPSIVPVLGRLGEVATVQAVVCEHAGALNRRQMLWLLPSLLSASAGGLDRRARKEYAHWKSATGTGGKSLQVMMGELIEGDAGPGGWQQTKVLGRPGAHRIEVPPLEDYTPSEKLRQEQEALGFVVSRNEMELVEVGDAVSSSSLYAHSDTYAGREVKVAGVIAAGRRHMGKDGNWMLFITLQDREGLIEVVVFSDAYKKHGELLATHGYGPYTITGTIQVSGKGRGIGVQPPSNLTPAGSVQLKSHPILIASKLVPLGMP